MELFVSMLLSYPFGIFCVFFGMVILGLYFFIIKKLLVVIIGVSVVGMGILYYGAGYMRMTQEVQCLKEAARSVSGYGKEKVPLSPKSIQQVPHVFATEKEVVVTPLPAKQLPCEQKHTIFPFF